MAISVENRLAISDAIHTFFHLVDSGHAAQTVKLFAPDAKLTFGPGSPQPGTIEGDSIAAAMIAREALKTAFTRHLVSNIIFDADAAMDEPTVTYLLTLFRSDDDTRSSVPAFVADVAETWRCADGRWQIAERTILPAFFRG
jgi:ketosteroid isomerase-like protein